MSNHVCTSKRVPMKSLHPFENMCKTKTKSKNTQPNKLNTHSTATACFHFEDIRWGSKAQESNLGKGHDAGPTVQSPLATDAVEDEDAVDVPKS